MRTGVHLGTALGSPDTIEIGCELLLLLRARLGQNLGLHTVGRRPSKLIQMVLTLQTVKHLP